MERRERAGYQPEAQAAAGGHLEGSAIWLPGPAQTHPGLFFVGA